MYLWQISFGSLQGQEQAEGGAVLALLMHSGRAAQHHHAAVGPWVWEGVGSLCAECLTAGHLGCKELQMGKEGIHKTIPTALPAQQCTHTATPAVGIRTAQA